VCGILWERVARHAPGTSLREATQQRSAEEEKERITDAQHTAHDIQRGTLDWPFRRARVGKGRGGLQGDSLAPFELLSWPCAVGVRWHQEDTKKCCAVGSQGPCTQLRCCPEEKESL
jgi:hypothetical protein